MIEIIICPPEGLIFDGNEIYFGMSQADIEKKIGKPAKFEVNNLINQIFEPRSGTIFRYKENELYSVDVPIDKGVIITYAGIDLLNDKEVIAKLSQYDKFPTPNNGKFMIFYELGICLGGFGSKRIPEKKMVTIFSQKQINLFRMQFLTGGGKLSRR